MKTRALRVKGLSDFFTRILPSPTPGIVAASRISNFPVAFTQAPGTPGIDSKSSFQGSAGTTRMREAPLSSPAAATTFPA